MPAPLNIANPEKKVTDANDVYLETWFVRENNAKTYITQYDFNGSSPMVTHTWTAPSGNVFLLDMSSQTISMDSKDVSTMTANERKIFFRYLSKFVGECLKNYNQNYNF